MANGLTPEEQAEYDAVPTTDAPSASAPATASPQNSGGLTPEEQAEYDAVPTVGPDGVSSPITVVAPRDKYLPPKDYNPTVGGVLGGAVSHLLPWYRDGHWQAGDIVHGVEGLNDAIVNATPFPAVGQAAVAGAKQVMQGNPQGALSAIGTSLVQHPAFQTESGLLNVGGGVLQNISNFATGGKGPQFADNGAANTLGRGIVDRWSHPLYNIQNNPGEMIGDGSLLIPGADMVSGAADLGRAAMIGSKAAEVADAARAADIASGADAGSVPEVIQPGPHKIGSTGKPTIDLDIQQGPGSDIQKANLQAARNQSLLKPTDPAQIADADVTAAAAKAHLKAGGAMDDTAGIKQTQAKMNAADNATKGFQTWPPPAATKPAFDIVDPPTTPPVPSVKVPKGGAISAGLQGGPQGQAFVTAMRNGGDLSKIDPVGVAKEASAASDDAQRVGLSPVLSVFKNTIRPQAQALAGTVSGVTPKIFSQMDTTISGYLKNPALQTPEHLGRLSDNLGALQRSTDAVGDKNYIGDVKRAIDDALETQAPTFQRTRQAVTNQAAAGAKATQFVPHDLTSLQGLAHFGAQVGGPALGVWRGIAGGSPAEVAGGLAEGALLSPRITGEGGYALGSALRGVGGALKAPSLRGIGSTAGTGALSGLRAGGYSHAVNMVGYANTNAGSKYDTDVSLADYLQKNPRYPISGTTP